MVQCLGWSFCCFVAMDEGEKVPPSSLVALFPITVLWQFLVQVCLSLVGFVPLFPQTPTTVCLTASACYMLSLICYMLYVSSLLTCIHSRPFQKACPKAKEKFSRNQTEFGYSLKLKIN